MITFEIEKDGQSIEFKFPSKAEEIKLTQYCMYEIKMNELNDFHLIDSSTLDDLGYSKYLYNLCDLLSCFTDKSLNDILNIPSDVVFKNSDTTDINGLESLFVMIHNVIQSYKPSNRKSFVYEGVKYIIPTMIFNKVLGKEVNPKLTTGEAILCYQYEYMLKAKESDTNEIKHKLTFNKILAMISILCRKKNEVLPIDEHEINTFEAKRMELFANIPFSIGLDIQYFFFNTQTTSKQDYSLNTLLRTSINKQVVAG